jgi:hypothetical protein
MGHLECLKVLRENNCHFDTEALIDIANNNGHKHIVEYLTPNKGIDITTAMISLTDELQKDGQGREMSLTEVMRTLGKNETFKNVLFSICGDAANTYDAESVIEQHSEMLERIDTMISPITSRT